MPTEKNKIPRFQTLLIALYVLLLAATTTAGVAAGTSLEFVWQVSVLFAAWFIVYFVIGETDTIGTLFLGIAMFLTLGIIAGNISYIVQTTDFSVFKDLFIAK